MSEHLIESTLFIQLISILHIEELLKLRRRCQMQNKHVLAAVLAEVIDDRDASEHRVLLTQVVENQPKIAP